MKEPRMNEFPGLGFVRWLLLFVSGVAAALTVLFLILAFDAKESATRASYWLIFGWSVATFVVSLLIGQLIPVILSIEHNLHRIAEFQKEDMQ